MPKEPSKVVVFPPPFTRFDKVWDKIKAGSATAGTAGVLAGMILVGLQKLWPGLAEPEVAAGAMVVLVAGLNGLLNAARNAWKHWYTVRAQK